MLKRMVWDGWRMVVVAAGSGIMLAASCSSSEIRAAVLAGVEVATDELLNSAEDDDDISFGDWLSSELDD